MQIPPELLYQIFHEIKDPLTAKNFYQAMFMEPWEYLVPNFGFEQEFLNFILDNRHYSSGSQLTYLCRQSKYSLSKDYQYCVRPMFIRKKLPKKRKLPWNWNLSKSNVKKNFQN